MPSREPLHNPVRHGSRAMHRQFQFSPHTLSQRLIAEGIELILEEQAEPSGANDFEVVHLGRKPHDEERDQTERLTHLDLQRKFTLRNVFEGVLYLYPIRASVRFEHSIKIVIGAFPSSSLSFPDIAGFRHESEPWKPRVEHGFALTPNGSREVV
jgi:hypothetical protein